MSGRGERPAGDKALDMRPYQGVTQAIVDKILGALAAEGMAVTGKNPWAVAVGKHGIKLTAVWNAATKVLIVAITDHDWLASSARIWAEIDPLLTKVIKGDGK